MRGKGEGSIYRRADGYWVGAIEAGRYPNGGRRKLRVVRKRRQDVVAALDELRQQVTAGAVPDRTTSVARFLEFWLDEVAAGNVTASSLNEYRKRIRRVVPVIGDVKLHRLTTAHVQRLANQLTGTYPQSPKTVRTTLETLRSALRWAVHAGMIVRNPAEGVRVRSAPAPKIDDTLTADEARAVIAAADGTDLHALAYLALTYGMRQGELLDLRWRDIDFDAGTLDVRKSKTRAGVRTLPLTDEAARLLRAHRRLIPMRGPDGYVFPGRDGGRRSPQHTRTQWSQLLERAGIEHRCRNCGTDQPCSSTTRRFHSSRHTAATLLLESGVQLEVVSAILGHANIGITAATYARVRGDLMRRGLTAVERQ